MRLVGKSTKISHWPIRSGSILKHSMQVLQIGIDSVMVSYPVSSQRETNHGVGMEHDTPRRSDSTKSEGKGRCS